MGPNVCTAQDHTCTIRKSITHTRRHFYRGMLYYTNNPQHAKQEKALKGPLSKEEAYNLQTRKYVETTHA